MADWLSSGRPNPKFFVLVTVNRCLWNQPSFAPLIITPYPPILSPPSLDYCIYTHYHTAFTHSIYSYPIDHHSPPLTTTRSTIRRIQHATSTCRNPVPSSEACALRPACKYRRRLFFHTVSVQQALSKVATIAVSATISRTRLATSACWVGVFEK
ncbi:hypothetical protein BC936DRAFT_140809 [Jimgerdemannia flammicorona]|uniref:Uncharacterized protein n=1 Tax=Jimgerdemannia flammicorona TaxID=994334 RepID=A0A433DGJ7_9FUNG|nr:hypothetical protein BC936DRAFT_140809 [Jimgerdemannia flammicorona]